MSRVVIEAPPRGRCPACGGPWYCADIDVNGVREYACLACARPPAPTPHREPDRHEAGRLTQMRQRARHLRARP